MTFQSEYDRPQVTVKTYEVKVIKIRHDPTSKVWLMGETLQTGDLPESTIKTFVERGYLKEVKNG